MYTITFFQAIVRILLQKRFILRKKEANSENNNHNHLQLNSLNINQTPRQSKYFNLHRIRRPQIADCEQNSLQTKRPHPWIMKGNTAWATLPLSISNWDWPRFMNSSTFLGCLQESPDKNLMEFGEAKGNMDYDYLSLRVQLPVNFFLKVWKGNPLVWKLGRF